MHEGVGQLKITWSFFEYLDAGQEMTILCWRFMTADKTSCNIANPLLSDILNLQSMLASYRHQNVFNCFSFIPCDAKVLQHNEQLDP